MSKLARDEKDRSTEVVTIRSAGAATGSSVGDRAVGGPDRTAARLGAILNHVVQHDAPPLFIADLEGMLLYANQGYRRISGLAGRDQSLGVSDQALPREARLALQEITKTGKRVSTVSSFEIDGESKRFGCQYFPIYDGDELVSVGGTYQDITAQARALRQAKLRDQRFKDFLRSTSDWLWETDARDRITFVSDRLAEVIGEPALRLKGRHLGKLGRFVAADEPENSLPQAMKARSAFRNQVYELIDCEGKIRSCHLSGVPVFDPGSGAFRGYRGTGTDVTPWRAAEREARQSRRELERALEELVNTNAGLDLALARADTAVEAQSEFMANMSHELRSPLNAIIGFSELMTQRMFGPLHERYLEYCGDILAAGRHLLALVNDILDMGKIETAALTLDPRPTALADLVAESLSFVTLRAEEKNIDTGAVQASEDWIVKADRTRALQILVNLLSNAVKFTPENGAIGVDLALSSDHMVEITVWDTGPGIARDKHAAVFEKFQQIHDGILSRRHDGAGLGLAIARQLARLMGGDIHLESATGRGSRFILRLPRARQEESCA